MEAERRAEENKPLMMADFGDLPPQTGSLSQLIFGMLLVGLICGGGIAGGIVLICKGQYGQGSTLLTAVVAIGSGIAGGIWGYQRSQDAQRERVVLANRMMRTRGENVHVLMV